MNLKLFDVFWIQYSAVTGDRLKSSWGAALIWETSHGHRKYCYLFLPEEKYTKGFQKIFSCGCLANLVNKWETKLTGFSSTAALSDFRKTTVAFWHIGKKRAHHREVVISLLALKHFFFPGFLPELCLQQTWSSLQRCHPQSCQMLLSEPPWLDCPMLASQHYQPPF